MAVCSIKFIEILKVLPEAESLTISVAYTHNRRRVNETINISKTPEGMIKSVYSPHMAEHILDDDEFTANTIAILGEAQKFLLKNGGRF